jgi:Pretoxin HINT domain
VAIYSYQLAGAKALIDITVDVDGDAGDATATITATDAHPFWVPETATWVDAADLQPGQWLFTAARTRLLIVDVNLREVIAAVHNLTIADIHTYYVRTGTALVLVHNDPTPVPPIILEAIEAYKKGELSQRMTGPKDAQVADFFRGDTGPVGARRFWKDAKIYEVPGGGNDWRLLVKDDGTIGWVGPKGGKPGAGHNYDRISTYRPPC